MIKPAHTDFSNDTYVVAEGTKLLVLGKAYPLAQIEGVSVTSESTYRSRALPFGLAVAFSLWTVSEVINAPDDYYTALFAGFLALVCFATVRLMGGLQVHTVVLNMAQGSAAVMRSRDGKAVSAVVSGVRNAIADHKMLASSTWAPGLTAHG